MWACQECGRKFKTTGAAERATRDGCPGCGGVDVDLDASPAKPTRQPRRDLRIEYPCKGSTYCRAEYGVYEYSEYPRGSVLQGQQRRQFLDSFETLDEAQAKYPTADVTGCGHREPSLSHLPDDEPGDPAGFNQWGPEFR